MLNKKFWLPMSVLVIFAMILAACAPKPEAPAAEMEEVDSYLAAAYEGKYDGTVVSMTGPFTDEDAVKFDNTVAAFEAATGIDIQYEGTKEFETTISIRVEGGDAPDIADFPQPGLLANFVHDGKVVDVNSFLDNATLSRDLQPELVGHGR